MVFHLRLRQTVNDRLMDTDAQGLDAGIRLVESIDRDMVHVRLTEPCGIDVAGTPSYLEKRGTPQKPGDLLHHDCIGFRMGPSDGVWAWKLERGKKTLRIPVRGPAVTNDSNLRRMLAVAGVGLIYGLEPAIVDDIAQGRLRVVLPQYAPRVPGLFLYFRSRAQVSPALKAFVDVAREVVRKR